MREPAHAHASWSALTRARSSLTVAEAYDDFKVEAVVHEIDGKDHTGAVTVGVPAIFAPVGRRPLKMSWRGRKAGVRLGDGGHAAGQGPRARI